MKQRTVDNFHVTGGKQLSGEVTVNTSKNGAVTLLAASLLNAGPTTLKSVPNIEEVKRLLEVLESLDVTVSWEGRDLTLTPPANLNLENIDVEAARKTRSIIMFIGPLIHMMRSFSLPQSGGCHLGSRTVRPHFFALENFGVDIQVTETSFEVSHTNLAATEVIMYESGDTATANAIMAAARIPDTTVIKYASANYQVQELCNFLTALGVSIDGIGTTTLTITGIANINTPITYTLTEDPTDAMFFLAAAATTNSEITIKRCPKAFLELELATLTKMNFRYAASDTYFAENGVTELCDITTHPSTLTAAPEKIHARPYPGLNIDNLPFFAVIATQAEGTTLIHDWTYEKRALYFTELDKLGAQTMLADPHRIFITGPTKLHGADLMSPPALRPATILLIGMLAAEGNSTLRNVYSINRGYEDLVTKLTKLGATITQTTEVIT